MPHPNRIYFYEGKYNGQSEMQKKRKWFGRTGQLGVRAGALTAGLAANISAAVRSSLRKGNNNKTKI